MSKPKSASLFAFKIPSSPNSCIMKVQGLTIRSLIDTGSELTLINRKIYDSLKNKPVLKRSKIALHSANGSHMEVCGVIDLDIKIQGLKFNHPFIVVKDLTRNSILGRDFLVKQKARLYFDLNKIRIRGVYIPMENDIHLAALSRATKNVTLKPQTACLMVAQIKNNPYFKDKDNFSFNPISRGFLENQPEIIVSSSLVKLKDRKIPVQIINSSNKTIRIRKGCLLGALTEISEPKFESKQIMLTEISNEEFNDQINVDNENRTSIESFLFNNKEVFAFSDVDLQVTDLGIAEIDTKEHKPINLRPYRIPLSQRQVVSDTIDSLLQAGLIRHSNSPWNFPIVLVEKKADKVGESPKKRMCVDFRALNQIVDIRSYPIPLIDDILANLKGSTYFTTLDLRSGFHQIPLSEQASDRCAFSCFKGKYQYNVMPFGLNNAPNIFQKVANKLLSGLEHFSMAYIDDILIFTKDSLNDHLSHVQIVLDRIKKHNLRLKLSKCQWAMNKIKYLGFVVDRQGISPCNDKVKAIKSLRPPETVKQVRGVLGMFSYYRRFIPRFTEIAEPLIGLTKKHARMKWNDKCQNAFDILKEQLTIVPMLAYPDVNKEYILYTDASDTTVGSVLVQEVEGEVWIPGIPNEKPIYFLSHKLSPTQIKSYSTIEKEMFAIYYSLQKLHFYLHNAKFTIKTDHQPLKYMFTAEQKNRRVQKWALQINSYRCTIEYLRGDENVTADLLSRSQVNDQSSDNNTSEDDNLKEVAVLNSNSFNPDEFLHVDEKDDSDLSELDQDDMINSLDINVEQDKDNEIVEIKRKLQIRRNEPTLMRKFMLKDNILYYISQLDDEPKLRLFVPKHLRDKIINQYHHENGHMGVTKTFLSIKEKYYWPKLYPELYNAIDSCVTCKQRNLIQQKAPIQTTHMAPYPMAVLQLDLSGPHPTTLSNSKYICSFVCLYSGWIECFSIPDKSAQSVVECFIEYILPSHSCCLAIQTDNGSEFNNQIFKDTLNRFNIKYITSSIYSPSSNGMVERSHRCLNDILSKLVRDHVQSWDLYIPAAVFAIRTNVSKTTLMSPFKILYNRDPVLPVDNLLRPRERTSSNDYHELAFENVHRIFVRVKKNMKKAKEARNEFANRKRKPINFKVGDPVFLKNFTKSTKLDKNWLTHYTIIEKRGPVSFTVRNQMTGKVKRVHANGLRLANIAWKTPKQEGRPIRKARLVTSLSESSSDEEEANSDSSDTVIYDHKNIDKNDPMRSKSDSSETIIYDYKNYDTNASTQSKSDSVDIETGKDNQWLNKGIIRERKVRKNSSSENEIPKFELRKKFRTVDDSDSEDNMEIDLIENKSVKRKKHKLHNLIDAIIELT